MGVKNKKKSKLIRSLRPILDPSWTQDPSDPLYLGMASNFLDHVGLGV